jgi:hypothetical protein
MKKINQVFAAIILTSFMLSACGPNTANDPNIGSNQVTAELKAKLKAIKGVKELIEPPKTGCLVSLLIDPSTDNKDIQNQADQIAPPNVTVCVHTTK